MAKVPLLVPGSVLQVQQNSLNLQTSSTSGATYIQSGLKCQITPKTTNSKFEVKGTVLINSRPAVYGMTAKIMVRNVTKSSSWVDVAMASGCDSHGIGSYASSDADQWNSAGFAVYGPANVTQDLGDILEFEVWFRAAGIGTAGSTTCRIGHPGRTSNIIITEIY